MKNSKTTISILNHRYKLVLIKCLFIAMGYFSVAPAYAITTEQQVEQNKQDIATVSGRVTSLESQVTSNKQTMEINKAQSDQNKQDIAALTSTTSSYNSSISTMENKVNDLNTKVSGYDSSINQLQSDVQNINNAVGSVSDLNTSTDTNFSHPSTIAGALNQLDDAINNLNLAAGDPTGVQDNKTSITNLEKLVGDVSDISSSNYIQPCNNVHENLSALDAAVDASSGDLITLKGKVNQNKTDIITNSNSIITLRNIDASHDNAIYSLRNKTGVNASNIATNTGAITTLNGQVTQNTTDISTNTGAITTLTGKVNQNETDIATNTGAITTLTGRVDQNEIDITTNTNNITTNTNNIDIINQKIGVAVNGNIIDQNNTINQNLSAIDSVIGDFDNLNDFSATNFKSPSTMVVALNNLDTAIGDRDIHSANALINQETADDISNGIEAVGNAIGSQNFTNDLSVDYNKITTGSDLTTAVNQLASNMGDGVDASYANISASKSISQNLDSIDTAIGALSNLTSNHASFDTNLTDGVGNLGVSGSSVSSHLQALDDTLGTIHGLQTKLQQTNADAGTNLATGTTIEQHLTALDSAIGNRAIASNNTAINTATQSSVADGFETVGNVVGSQTYSNTQPVSYTNISQGTDLTTAISQVSSNIGASVSGTYNNVSAGNTVNQNLDSLDTAIGDLATIQTTNNTMSAGASVVDNLNAIDSVLGDVNALGSVHADFDSDLTDGVGNLSTSGSTVADHLTVLDNTLGTIHGLQSKLQEKDADSGTNLASGTTVEQHLTTIDAAIGNRTIASLNNDINTATVSSVADGLEAVGNALGDVNFGGTNYLNSSVNLTSAIRSLDSALGSLEQDMHTGLASSAALSGLVPNPRASGDTQVSIGVGNYHDRVGMAIGAFHYLNDNLLLNVGASYSGDNSAMFKGGVTFGW